ncbi:MAG: hypothetical protein ACLP50_15645 [Solirubrobacteraceae bacterium]
MDEHDDQFQPLVSDLRALIGDTDPVPPLVTEAAKAAFGWRRLDADLAELLADSSLETESLARTRGAGAPVRSVTFSAGGLTIDIEIHSDGAQRTLLGQLSPRQSVTIEIQTLDDNQAATAATDSLGRFRARITGGHQIRLRIVGEPPSATVVETSWVMI